MYHLEPTMNKIYLEILGWVQTIGIKLIISRSIKIKYLQGSRQKLPPHDNMGYTVICCSRGLMSDAPYHYYQPSSHHLCSEDDKSRDYYKLTRIPTCIVSKMRKSSTFVQISIIPRKTLTNSSNSSSFECILVR